MSIGHENAKRWTEKYKSKLTPCKHCGTIPHIEYDRIGICGQGTKAAYYVVCGNCGDCIDSFTSVRKAIERWNEHAPKANEGNR